MRGAILLLVITVIHAFQRKGDSFISSTLRRNRLVGTSFSRLKSSTDSHEGEAPTGDPMVIDGLQSTELIEELKSSFMSYAMSTILSRALPDVRDGLKPVHRRVLYAMQVLNLTPESGYRKCARVVGEVLGKYHPHGDQSVYDALVRLAQDFVTNHPLIQGHGNFGTKVLPLSS